MKKIKVLLCFLLTVILLFSVFTFSSSAAETTITLSKDIIYINDTLIVTLTFDTGEPFFAISATIFYDNNILEYKSGNAVGGGGVLKLVESTLGETMVKYSFEFQAKTAGSAKISVTDCYFSDGSKDMPLSSSSAIVYVTPISNTVSFISIANFPERREYLVGEDLDLSGGKIAVGYANGTYDIFDLKQSMVSNYNMNKTGLQIINVIYNGYSTEFSIKIHDNSDLNGDKKLNSTDLILIRHYLLFGEKANADLNGDGVFDLRDLIHLKKKIAKIII